MKLTQLEEEVIVSYILELDQCGFAPTYAAVRNMADKLLTARSAGQVGVHWPRNFVKPTNSLTTRFNRAYNRQRALCEDSVLIKSWFDLVDVTNEHCRNDALEPIEGSTEFEHETMDAELWHGKDYNLGPEAEHNLVM